MKFLFAFALIAVAFAAEDIKGVHLPPAPAPEVASPDQIRIAQVPLDALNVPTTNEQAEQEAEIVRAEPIYVGETQEILQAEAEVGVETPEIVHETITVSESQSVSEDIQDEPFKILIADMPVDSVAEQQITPVRTAEIPADVQNIKSMEPMVEEPVQPVKVAAPVFEDAAPLAIEKVRVFDPSMPPRYADPVLR